MHGIEYTISVTRKGKDLVISFDPFIVKVLGHDLPAEHTFFPVVGCRCKDRVDRQLFFDGFIVAGEFKDIILADDVTAVDQTLTTNWTHGGAYKGKFDIILQVN